MEKLSAFIYLFRQESDIEGWVKTSCVKFNEKAMHLQSIPISSNIELGII